MFHIEVQRDFHQRFFGKRIYDFRLRCREIKEDINRYFFINGYLMKIDTKNANFENRRLSFKKYEI